MKTRRNYFRIPFLYHILKSINITNHIVILFQKTHIMADLITTLTPPSIITWHLRDPAYRFLSKSLSVPLYITSIIATLFKNEALAYNLWMLLIPRSVNNTAAHLPHIKTFLPVTPIHNHSRNPLD